MAIRRNQGLGGGAGSLLTGTWALYSTFTTAKDLPGDAGWIARMIADPPIYAPWLLFVLCVLFLAWVFWHREKPQDDAGVSTSGDSSPVISEIGAGAVVSVNQSGGVTAATYINHMPDPECEITGDSDWQLENDGTYSRCIMVRIKHGASIDTMRWSAVGKGLGRMNWLGGCMGSPVVDRGRSEDEIWMVLRYFEGLSGFCIVADAPTNFKFGWDVKTWPRT